MSEPPEPTDPERRASPPSKLEVGDPLRPFSDIIDIFRSIAQTGAIHHAPTSASSISTALDDGPLDLDAILKRPDVLATHADTSEPGAPGAPNPAPLAPPTASGAFRSDTSPSGLTDLQAIIDAASAALAEIDGEPAPAPAVVTPATPDPHALAALLASFDLPTDHVDELIPGIPTETEHSTEPVRDPTPASDPSPAGPAADRDAAPAEAPAPGREVAADGPDADPLTAPTPTALIEPHALTETGTQPSDDEAAEAHPGGFADGAVATPTAPATAEPGEAEEPGDPAVRPPTPLEGEVVPATVLAALLEPIPRFHALAPAAREGQPERSPDPRPNSHRAVPPPTPRVVPDPATDAAAAVVAVFHSQQSERAEQAARAEAPATETEQAERSPADQQVAEPTAPTEAAATLTAARPLTEAIPEAEQEGQAESAEPDALPRRRRRRWLTTLVAAVVALALMAGTGWFLARGPLARTASTTPTTTPTTGPTQLSVPIAPRQDDYAAVLATVTDATDLASLSAAADHATTLGQEFSTLKGATPEGQHLINAETAALQAFSALDALTPGNAAAQFPALASTVRSAAKAVAKARTRIPGSDPATRTTPAADHVVTLVAPLALNGLTTQLNTAVRRAAAATKTAGLRQVADDTFQLRISTEDTAAVLGTKGRLAERAAHLQQAVASVAAMKAIDGDHLDQWTTTGTQLRQQLAALGQSTAPVAKIDEMITSAALLMKTWTELHAGPDRKALTAYREKVTQAMRAWTRAWADLPDVKAGQKADFGLTTRFYQVSQALDRGADSLGRITVPDQSPDGLAAQQRALAALARRGRGAAVAGHNVALAAEDCGADCTFGTAKGWKAFRAALARVGNPTAAQAAWQAAYGRAAEDAGDADAEKPDV